ncbi:hypothetical protein SLA2020_036380 [Shorea laevis]
MEWSPIEMIQQAKEELELLETHHPNRFQYLKLDLKAFILLLQSQQSVSSTVTVATQASSTGRKRKRGGGKFGRGEEGDRRVDLVLERAESCLQKIRKLKSTLC